MSAHAGRGWRWGVALGCLLAGTGARAETWYQVEVIAFRHAAEESGNWAAVPVLPDYTAATRLTASEDPSDPLAPVAYQQLPAHELKLAGAYQVLARSGDLQPLLHAGWHQPAGDSRAVYLSTAMSDPAAQVAELAPAQFEGTVRLNLDSAVFQLNTSCVFRVAETPVALAEARKLKVDELHYLDHPLAGLLIQVTALAAPPAAGDGALTAPPVEDAGVLPD